MTVLSEVCPYLQYWCLEYNERKSRWRGIHHWSLEFTERKSEWRGSKINDVFQRKLKKARKKICLPAVKMFEHFLSVSVL